MPHRRRPAPWVTDVVVGSVAVATGLLTTAAGDEASSTYEPFDLTALVLVLAATVPYFLRRRAPATVFAGTTLAVAVLMLAGYDPGLLPIVLVFGAYTVGVEDRPREMVVSGAIAIGGLVVLAVADVQEFGLGEMLSTAAVFIAAFAVGWTMQSRRRLLELAEQGKVAVAQRAAADERLRIAQELHDVVAHSLGVIAVQAGAGARVIDADPMEARRAFDNIGQTSRAALTEIRGLLGEVRNPDGTPAYQPAPGLADLAQLAHRVTDAGIEVSLEVEGDVERVPPGVGLAAYRIVQEALTNTLRHASAHHAVVRVGNDGDVLAIDVTDDGRGSGGTGGGGHGLVGMRERVAVYGGSLSAGPVEGGGFRVLARLPYEPEPAG